MRRLSPVLAMMAWLPAVVLPGPASAKPPASEAPVVSHPALDWGALVSLGDQRLLVWDDRGGVQVSDAVGKWLPPMKVPFGHIWAVVADPKGFLLSSSTDKHSENDVVALFDTEGRELQRWSPDKEIFGLVSDGHRWARTPTGLRELLPDGRVGELIPFLDGKPGRTRDLAVFERDGKRVVCMTADRTKENATYSGCKDISAGGWHFEDLSSFRPLLCGPWLVVLDGTEANRLEVHSFTTGKVVSKRSYRAPPTFACTPEGTLLVGQRQLQELALPSLTPRWSRGVGPQPVRDVAVLREYAAYTVRGSSDVRFVRRP